MNRPFHFDAYPPCPRARIPASFAWELVEFLASQRTLVTYTYTRSFVLVDFLSITGPAAQRLLENWSNTLHPQPRDQLLPAPAPPETSRKFTKHFGNFPAPPPVLSSPGWNVFGGWAWAHSGFAGSATR